MSKIKLTGESSGYVEISAGASAGNNTLDLPSGKVKLVGADSSDNIVVGVATGSNFKTGSSNLHSTGLSVGDTLLHTTGLNVGTGVTIHSPASNTLILGTNGSERLRIDSSGRIGINRTPSQKLDILNGSDANVIVMVRGADATSEYAAIGVNGGNAVITGGGSGGTSAGIVFRTAQGGAEAEKVRITSAGGVLIGGHTSAVDVGNAPNLEIVNTSTSTLTLARNDTSIASGNDIAAIRVWGNDSNGTYQQCAEILAEADGDHGTGDKPTALAFKVTADGESSPRERFRITSAGHLGIGTDSVSSRLTVYESQGRCLRVGQDFFGVFQTKATWTSRSYTENPIILWDYNSTFGDNVYIASGGNGPNSNGMGLIVGDNRGIVAGKPSYNGTDTGIDMSHAREFFRVHKDGKVYAGGGINFATNNFGDNYANHSSYGFSGGGQTDGVIYRAVGQLYLAVDDLFRIRDNIDNSENKRFEFNTNNGNGDADASWRSNQFDFAEMFEWSDGNPDAEDRIGYSVCVDTLTGKIRKAEEGDTPFGIVSGTASFVANAGGHKWAGYSKRDEWGRILQEPAYNGEGEPLLDDEGNHRTKMAVNPEWDESLVHDYVPRSERPEWATIGVMGQVYMRKGCPVDSRWVKLKEIDSVKDLWLVR